MVDKQQSHLIFGTREFNVHTIRDTLSSAEDLKVDFVVVPLFHPRLRRDLTGISSCREGPVTRSDRELDSKDWIANIVGEISGWIDCDNPDPRIQKSSERAMRQEFAWASHLGLQALVFPMPCLRSPNFAAIIQQLCAAATYQQLWVKIPLSVPLDFRNSRLNLNHITDGWEVWDSLRHLAGHNDRLFCCLELSDDLPDDLSELKRWAAEPLKAIIIPTRIFLENKKGYPVLSKQHQAALSLLLQFKMHVIFSGKPKMQSSLTPYIQYIQHLRSRDVSLLTEGERFTFCYKDTLQSPLQPLMDNLESQTYETFERDPVKYERYEAAIVGALTDLSIASRLTNSSAPAEVVVTVVGAGRGPLVAAALSASNTTGVRIRVYAVEKNKNAIITLRNRVLTELWTNVTVIAGDMRSSRPIEQADILVSELLGSWGDNELSPECLDGARDFLKPGGLSIPSSYTSFVAPMSSSKLWMGARGQSGSSNGKGLSTPYVVKFHNHFPVADAASLFRFDHPNLLSAELIDNTRYSSVSFTVSTACTMHGFAGTFESVLYKDVMISIAPQSHSPGMFSWFPLFIPLASPLRLQVGDVVTANIWRYVDDRKVWYEWCLSSPVCTPIQNSGGSSSWIGL